jgi:hypothetical protein
MKIFVCRQEQSSHTVLQYTVVWSNYLVLAFQLNDQYTAPTWAYCGPGSVVGIATGYGLDGPGIEAQWGASFFAPVQTGPGAHPASCTMGTGSFPGVKAAGTWRWPLLVSWSWKGRAISLFYLRAVRPVQSLSACTRSALYLLGQMTENTDRLVANHLSCSRELNRIFAIHKTASEMAQLTELQCLQYWLLLFGRTSQVNPHSK